jgi:hypothetical protein
LSRQKTEKKTTEKAKESRIPEYQLQQVWNIAENTGRRYAKVSGDLTSSIFMRDGKSLWF